MRRSIIVDTADYSNKEIQQIQDSLNKSRLDIAVFRDFNKDMEVLLCANASINYSIEALTEIVGAHYVGSADFENQESYEDTTG
ncbi:MAG TPA: hypothetical protein PKX31_00095 [Chitinophagaceae bacterium]|nr:hypothetical protein [Chitinophagaceae bacterium]